MAREDSLTMMVLNSLRMWLKTKNAAIAIVGTIVLLGALAWLFSYQVQAFPAQDPFNVAPVAPDITGPDGAKEETRSTTGYADEGQAVDVPFDMEGSRIWAVEVTITFQDESATRPRFTNTPDHFDVTVAFPDGMSETKTDYASSQSAKTMTFVYNFTEDGGMDWTEEGGNSVTVTVECTSAGDQEPFFPFLGFRNIPDDGNEYSLSVFYIYTEET